MQKKKISRSYQLLTKVESGKYRRLTAAINVIVTLCRKSVGKRVCNVLRVVSAVMRRQFFDEWSSTKYILNRNIFHSNDQELQLVEKRLPENLFCTVLSTFCYADEILEITVSQ